MSEIFQEPVFGSFELGGPTPEEARRAYALDLAVRIHCSRVDGRPPALGHAGGDRDVLQTADRFVTYIRGGGEGD